MDNREYFYINRFNYEAFYKNNLEGWEDLNGRNGLEVKGICPFHDDTQQSFNANTETGLWYCHGCGRSGWVGTFLMLLDGLPTHREAIAELKKDKNSHYWGNGAEVEEPYHIKEERTRETQTPPSIDPSIIEVYQSALTDDRKQWLIDNRKLTSEIIEKARIGFCEASNRYTLPITNKTGQEFIDVRLYHPDPPPTGKTNKKGEPILEPKMKSFGKGYGYKKWYSERLLSYLVSKRGAKYFICEGEFDNLTAMSNGLENIVTWINGANAMPPNFTEYARDASIITVFDNDPAGQGAARETARQALMADCKQISSVEWPEDFPEKGDITDWIKSGKTIRELIDLPQRIWNKGDFQPEELLTTTKSKKTKSKKSNSKSATKDPQTKLNDEPGETHTGGIATRAEGIKENEDGSVKFPGGDIAQPWAYWKKRLNKRYAVISYSGRTFVMENQNIDNREKLIFHSPQDFKALYHDELVITGLEDDGSLKTERVGKWWLDHQLGKTKYHGLNFAPGKAAKNMPKDFYNLYRGLGVEPKKGSWTRMRDHIYEVICDSNPEYADYLINWMAHIIQHPEQRTGISLVLNGGKGTGKGAFVNAFGKILGSHFTAIADQSQLKGSFTDYVQSCILLFFDEGFFAGDKSTDGKVKAFITEPTLNINKKFKDTLTIPNYLNLIFASNEDRPVNATIKERRYFSLTVSDCRQGDFDYFDELFDEIKAGGVEAMLYDLLEWPINDFDPRKTPKTEALIAQVDINLPIEIKWLQEALLNGFVKIKGTEYDFPHTFPVEDVHNAYLEYADSMNERRPLNSVHLSRKLVKIFGDDFTGRSRFGGKYNQRRVWHFGQLNIMRQAFDRFTGFESDWQTDVKEQNLFSENDEKDD